MGFQIIKAETRLANMVTWFAGIQKMITDFVVGGKTRTKFEAIAVELEAQDLQFYIAARKAIATGIYQSFNFQLLPAVRASGSVTLTAASAPTTPIVIPAGTKVATAATGVTPEKVYQTTSAAQIGVGQTQVTVPISAVTAGTNGNTGTGTITVLKTTISGISTVTNAEAITNGADKETEASRRIRFQEYISTLARGTAAALVYGAKTAYIEDNNGNITERVTAAIVTGPPETGPAGSCTIYIFNGVNGASADLIARTQSVIDGYTDAGGNLVPGYKAAGVVATVAPAETFVLDVTVTLVVEDGATVTEAMVLTTINNYIRSLQVGGKFIYNELVERLMGLPGVMDLYIEEPIGNLDVSENQVIIPGTISATISTTDNGSLPPPQ